MLLIIVHPATGLLHAFRDRASVGVKVPSQRSSQVGGQTAQFAPQISQYGIMGLETTEYTDDRVHFPGLVETVSVVHGCVWSPLGRNPDFA